MIKQSIENYLQNTFGIQPKLIPWKGEKSLPFYLRDAYSFYQGSFLGYKSLLFVPRKHSPTPAKVHSDLKKLSQYYDETCIYACLRISSYDRKRLIAYHIPFIIPGNQMYLPGMGIDLREHFRKKQIEKTALSPSSQALLIYTLLHKDNNCFSSSILEKELQYSRMSIIRAMNELLSHSLGENIFVGKEKALQVPKNRKELWECAKSLLSTPVKRRYFIKQRKKSNLVEKLGILSGISALSKYSMIQPPRAPTYAIEKNDWQKIQTSNAFEEVFTDLEANYEIEVWKYDPKLFAKKRLIDPYSLYLSLKEISDERVEAALESMEW